MNVNIKIVVEDVDTGETICKSESLLFESAEQELGKMERFINKLDHTKVESQSQNKV